MERKEKVLALAVNGEMALATPGQAKGFLLFSAGESRFLPSPSSGKGLVAFLQQHKVEILLCRGIGNCMAELLELMGIRVIPGVEGAGEEVLQKWSAGELAVTIQKFCTDFGKSCGACPGYF